MDVSSAKVRGLRAPQGILQESQVSPRFATAPRPTGAAPTSASQSSQVEGGQLCRLLESIVPGLYAGGPGHGPLPPGACHPGRQRLAEPTRPAQDQSPCCPLAFSIRLLPTLRPWRSEIQKAQDAPSFRYPHHPESLRPEAAGYGVLVACP